MTYAEEIQRREAELEAGLDRLRAGGNPTPAVVREVLARAELAPPSGGHAWPEHLALVARWASIPEEAACRVLAAAGVRLSGALRGSPHLDTTQAEEALFASAEDAYAERKAAMAAIANEWKLLTHEELVAYLDSRGRGTAKRLAEALGVSRTSIGGWRAGKRAPALRYQEKLARLVRGETLGEIEAGPVPKPPTVAEKAERWSPSGSSPEPESESVQGSELEEEEEDAIEDSPSIAEATVRLIDSAGLLLRALAGRLLSPQD